MNPLQGDAFTPRSVLRADAARLDNPCVHQLQLIDDIKAIQSLLRQALPVLDLARQTAPGSSAQGSWFYGSQLAIGSLDAAAWISSPLRMRLSQHGQLLLLLGYGGELRVRQAERTWHCIEDSCLLMASEACSLESSTASALAFPVSKDRLLQAAIDMGGGIGKPAGWNQLITQAHGWQHPSDPAAPSLQAALRQQIAAAVQLTGHSKALVERLNMDDQIYRYLAAMLVPELQQDHTLDRLLIRQREGRDAFDELIDYLKENLSEPLNLTMMESRSHYSRRAIQYAFLERMGCSATQWIRKQRLELARRRLENPKPGDTVGTIANACGYRSLGLFSVDFQQRYHVKPSQLLREARLSQPAGQEQGGSAPSQA
jgi:AraC-like DNA-binding protein